ncbi:MAG: TetR/AcrR family transcriptional regulator [Actinomycetota bacterium]
MNKSRWEEIMAVAARLFREKGYRATTMDDIATELNVTKPALYYYIDNKHDLLYAICESATEKLMEGAKGIMRGPGDVVEKLRRLLRWHVSMFSAHGDVFAVYLAEEGELPPEKRDFIRGLSREYESYYRRLLEEGIREGKFREVDVPMAVRAISGMCNWLSVWFHPEGKYGVEEVADIFFDLFLRGCERREG